MRYACTGRKRLRLQTRWFCSPLLVLQVELAAVDDDGTPLEPHQLELDERAAFWRDATVSDLTVTEP